MPEPDPNAIAILGGTGDQGLGLALRFAKAGRPIAIGSRKLGRAEAAAKEVLRAVSGADVVGLENADAARWVAPVVRYQSSRRRPTNFQVSADGRR